MTEQQIVTANGTWTVLKKDDEICIVDPMGRCRHQSKGHMSTATHLAMHLAERKFDSVSNVDEALRMTVEEFRKEEE